MRVLELFSGTGSVGKVAKKLGWEVLSLDLELEADININILDWDYKVFSPDTFDIVWASPPCISYSRLQCSWIGRVRNGKIFTKDDINNMMDESDKLVLKSLEIIKYFNPEFWFLENPQTGRLKDRDIMKDIPFYDVDYCMYSNWGYQKRTRIWTNKTLLNNLICDKSGSCGNMIDGKHKARLGTGKTVMDNGKIIRVNTAELRKKYKNFENINDTENNGMNLLDRYRIPENLIFSLFQN